MKNLFKHASSSWVRYSKYEWKKDKNNKYYITPAPDAQMMFSFMLVDETSTLKLCPNCYKAFFTENEDDVYCSSACESDNQ